MVFKDNVKDAKVCVIGLGYVGLPLAVLAKRKGFDVVGVDKDDSVVKKCKEGVSHIDEAFLHEWFAEVGSLDACLDVVCSDVYIICVPTPVDKKKYPDLTYVKAAVSEVASVVEDNQLVIVESTINPGVCEEVVLPLLEASGKHVLLAHCPERINPGDAKWHVDNIPRVVGGISLEAGEYAKAVYDKLLDAEVTLLSDIKAAEATKIMENTFRDVNIAFVNEMAMSFYRMGIDVSEVIRGAETKPFSFLAHYPGMGVGGHCIAVDPYYMIERGRDKGFEHNFLIRARKINAGMPRFVANLLQSRLNFLKYPVNGTRIAVLGLSYKPGVADDRESPSYDLINILRARGADLAVFDPYLPEKSSVGSLEGALDGAVCVVIATAHKQFLDESLYCDVKLLIDGRNCLDKSKVSKNVLYVGIGVSR